MAEEVDADLASGDDGSDPCDTETKATLHEQGRAGVRLALAVGAVAVVALTGLVGWLGYREYESYHAEQQRELFLQVGRQSALDLTTISHAEADADVQRILDLATGTFHDDFKQRSQQFVDVVKQEQSKTEGTITEVGLQSVAGDSARVLVAVSVTTTTAAVPEPHLNRYRMRIDVQRVGDRAKVSNVEFIP